MRPNDVLSIQLWSTRASGSLAEQLEYLACCGYTDVQPFKDLYSDPAALRAMLDEYGLTARSGHFKFSTYETDFDRVVTTARTLGMTLLAADWLDPEDHPVDRAGWEALGGRLSSVSRRLADQGLRFAWHNHEFEFAPLPDGSVGIEHALGEDVLWEMDIGWVFKAEQDPLVWLARYAGRVPAIHVKDVAAPGEKLDEMNFADLGEGVMDWRLYWQAAVDAGAELMIAEHDAPSDWRRFARVSVEAMRRFASVAA
jgi:sugar phosphate isomerase/epimerase